MKRLICNLKMNYSLEEILNYKEIFQDKDYNNSLIICPSFCYLPVMHSKNYLIGAQNVSENTNGAHTGEVSAEMLKSIDVKRVLLNHFEVNDEKEIVKKKLQRCLENKMFVYLFISETEEEHYYQYTVNKLCEQIEFYLEGISKEDYQYINFVYEPSWLIGREQSLTLATIKNVFYIMKKELKYHYGYSFPLFYGGGLKYNDISHLVKESMIDGFVLGTGSLMPLEVKKILDIL